MNKKERKEFRTLLYQRYGAQYMEDKDSVEALYDVPFNWVMLEVKAGWHPTLILTEWKKRFNKTQAICVELLGNTVALEAWNDMVTSFAVFNQPTRLRKCLATGMKPETARTYLSTNWPDDVFNSAIQDYQRATFKPLDAKDLLVFSLGSGAGKTSSLSAYLQTIGRGLRATVTRGEPAFVTKWKELREETLKKMADRLYVHPALAYNLLYLNYMIGDHQPKGDRVLRLSHVDIADYRTFDRIEKERGELLSILSGHMRGADKIKAARELVDIEVIIAHCNRRAGYKDYQEDIIKQVSASFGIPADMLTAPMPPVSEAVKAHYRKVFGPHAVPAFGNHYLDGIYKAFVETPKAKSCPQCYTVTCKENPVCTHCGHGYTSNKRKEFPGGFIDMRGADKPLLQSVPSKYIVYDCLEGGGDVVDWAKVFMDERHRTFTNTILGEPYNPMNKADAICTVTRRPFAFNIEVKDNFSSQINKIKTAMQNTTNGGAEMSKEAKRARIKELEAALELIKTHKAQIAKVEKTMREKPAATLRTILAVQNDGGHNFEQFTMFGQDFMKPEMMLKIYKVELDEEEARVNVELNKLIA